MFLLLYLHLLNTQTLLTWWQPIVHGAKPAPRAAHSATVVGNKVFVFGGNDGTTLFNDLHVLDTGASCQISEWLASTKFHRFNLILFLYLNRHTDVVAAHHARLSAASARGPLGDARRH